MSLLRRQPRQALTPEQKEARSRERQARLERAREAKQATRAMGPNEAKYGLYVALILVALGVFSFLGHDYGPVLTTHHGKSVSVMTPYKGRYYPGLVLAVVGAVAGGTLYWRLRMRSGLVFMLAAVLGLETIYPKGYADLNYVAFGLPAIYVMWMLMFRMNKEQREYVSARTPASSAATRAGNPEKRRAAVAASSRQPSGRRRSKTEPQLSPSGRPLPSKSRRYTPPKPKPAPDKGPKGSTARRDSETRAS